MPYSCRTPALRSNPTSLCWARRSFFNPAPPYAILSNSFSSRCLRCRRSAFHRSLVSCLRSVGSVSWRLALNNVSTSSECFFFVELDGAVHWLAATMYCVGSSDSSPCLTIAWSSASWYASGFPFTFRLGCHPTWILFRLVAGESPYGISRLA